MPCSEPLYIPHIAILVEQMKQIIKSVQEEQHDRRTCDFSTAAMLIKISHSLIAISGNQHDHADSDISDKKKRIYYTLGNFW